ncbi:MAG: asparaginase [Pseudomonadota bacterium]
MTDPVVLAELWRGDFLESRHFGHAVIVDDTGQIVDAWGDPDKLIYPRSSAKMLQALPLLESGAAREARLTSEHLALACASHIGAASHTRRVVDWLTDLGLAEADLRCGAQVPSDRTARHGLRAAGDSPSQIHNNCSGKHSGFLTLSRHLKAGSEYIDVDHPVQRQIRASFEEMAGEVSPGFGIDGCSAPNFTCTLLGFARALARMAAPEALGPTRKAAVEALVGAMIAHPDLVAGEGKACTALMRAAPGVALKTGAEGVYAAILPRQRKAIALKVEDGATRASEAAIAALLVRLGVLEADDPVALAYTRAEVRNRRHVLTGHVRAAPYLLSPSPGSS